MLEGLLAVLCVWCGSAESWSCGAGAEVEEGGVEVDGVEGAGRAAAGRWGSCSSSCTAGLGSLRARKGGMNELPYWLPEEDGCGEALQSAVAAAAAAPAMG